MKQTTQKEVKNLIKFGAAIELTDTKPIPAGRVSTVALSFGLYGMNGAILKDDETGQLYAIPRRDGILFYYC